MSTATDPSETAISPVMAGLTCRCVMCGKGKVFQKYLKFHSQCPECGQDFSKADTADGPAFFVGFLVMVLFAPFYFVVPLMKVAVVTKVILFAVIIGLMLGACLLLLPRAKALLLALQLRHRAGQARLDV